MKKEHDKSMETLICRAFLLREKFFEKI